MGTGWCMGPTVWRETGLSDKRLELYVALDHSHCCYVEVCSCVTKPDLGNGPREGSTQTSCSALASVREREREQ